MIVLVTDLPIAVKNAKQIFQKIKSKYPQIRVFLVLSTRNGQAPINSGLEHLLDFCDDFFIENDAVKSAWTILDELWNLTQHLSDKRKEWSPTVIRQAENKIETVRQRYAANIPRLELDDEVEICLRWDDIDYDINRKLGVDSELVDVGRSNTTIGGIKICLGTVRALSQ